MTKYSRALVCVLLWSVALVTEIYAFSIEPGRIELVIPPGRQRGKTVTVDNRDSDEPLHLKVYVTDVIFLPDGTNDFPQPGATTWSCAKWVRMTPDEIDVPAKKTQTVRINVAVPEGAQGGYYGMLFFESGAPSTTKGLSINFRVGGLIDITVSGTEQRSAKVAHISLSNPKKIEVGIFNEGNVLARPKGKVKIMDARGKRIQQLEFNPRGWGVLPRSLRKLYVDLDKPLASGQYTVRVEVNYGTKYLLVGESPVQVQ
jgi:hypothetical protein